MFETVKIKLDVECEGHNDIDGLGGPMLFSLRIFEKDVVRYSQEDFYIILVSLIY